MNLARFGHLCGAARTGAGATGMRFPFTKADRIRSTGEYRTLSRDGRRYANDLFVVVYRKHPLSHTRLGITVSKKVGKAVTRNRVKRIIREFFRLNRNLLPGQLDINLIARQTCRQAGSADIRERLRGCFKRLSAQSFDHDDRQAGTTAD